MPRWSEEGYGLIGGTLKHSYSPQIHALLGDYPYGLFPMAAEEIPAFLAATRLDGFNVTIPHKQAVMPYLQHISEEARRIGSVNTVSRTTDGWHGDNTDVWGFAQLLGNTQPFRGRKALVLGSGGSARTVQVVLKDAGIQAVVVSRAGPVTYQDLDAHRDAALVVNTTPVGMYPNVDESPLDLARFPDCQLVVDLIYNPHRTTLLLEAQALGMEARDGLLMLTAQAQRASELFGLRAPGQDVYGEIADALRKRMLNIVLIGMPGCGKTAVGKALAKLLGRPFVDTDALVEQRAGQPIPELIASQGVDAFRQLESAVLADAAKESGTVIATGGGIVTVPHNLTTLRRNCRVVHIARPLSDLPVAGRPLSQGQGVEALWAAREPMYRQFRDALVNNIGVADTAQAIREILA